MKGNVNVFAPWLSGISLFINCNLLWLNRLLDNHHHHNQISTNISINRVLGGLKGRVEARHRQPASGFIHQVVSTESLNVPHCCG